MPVAARLRCNFDGAGVFDAAVSAELTLDPLSFCRGFILRVRAFWPPQAQPGLNSETKNPELRTFLVLWLQNLSLPNPKHF